ncbi:MAG: methyltransferase domain-containing protein [Geodermatophilaceae bacterium]|nr:methyltransferase domain-containing protein [Geodermatophilaceae bacterium]
MTGMLDYDAATSRRIEQTYTTPDVVEQRAQVLAALALRPGERVLDIGSGPGLLAWQMAAAVGADGRIDGIDPSESMLSLAAARDDVRVGAAPVVFRRGDTESIPLPDASVDVAVATQVLEYVADIPRALAEMYRVLRPGGRVLVLDTDWESVVWHSRDPGRMARVLTAWEAHLADPYLPRRLGSELRRAGFDVDRAFVWPLLNVGYVAQTYSGGLIELVAAFIGNRGHTEGEAWAADLCSLGEDYFFSLNRYLFCATKPV